MSPLSYLDSPLVDLAQKLHSCVVFRVIKKRLYRIKPYQINLGLDLIVHIYITYCTIITTSNYPYADRFIER